MRKALTITGFTLGFLLAGLLIAPYLLKDRITAMVKQQINDQLDARVYFGEVGLSLIRNFPNARIQVRDFGVVGAGVFDQDTLIQGPSFDLVVDLLSLLPDREPVIKRIYLDEPRIHAIVLQDERANWDVLRADTAAAPPAAAPPEAPADTAAAPAFTIALESYEIENATLVYEDATLPMLLVMNGLDHRGSGDFTAEVFDLSTRTKAEKFYVEYGGIEYLKKARFSADADMKVNYQTYRFDLKNNLFVINELGFTLDGYFAMPTDDIEMDLRFAARETDFRSLLSLVPGVYTEQFDELQTEGELGFEGAVKGVLTDSLYPGFDVQLRVANGRMQYPDVPKPITGINVDMRVSAPAGDLEQTHIEVRSLHADLGPNPVDVQADLKGLSRMAVKGQIRTRVNLADLTSMFPIEGTTLKGDFTVDATADGVYDAAAGTFPQVDARMFLEDGYLKNAEYPAELQKLEFHATLTDADGTLRSAVFDMPDFAFTLDGEPIEGKLHVENFDDPRYALQAQGNLDLEKLLQVYPVEGLALKGKLFVDQFATRGRYSDVMAGRYASLPTSGQVQVQNLVYSDATLPAPVEIRQGAATFTPAKIDITGLQGRLGRSDYAVDGYVSNYLAYVLMEEGTLQGNLALKAQKLDLNEWLAPGGPGQSGVQEVRAPAEDPAEQPAAPMSVFPVPANLKLAVQAEVGEVLYDKLRISQIKGAVDVEDQALSLREVACRMLGSQVLLSGQYSTADLRRPLYNFYMNVQQLAVREFFRAFPTARQFAPAFEYIEGVCNAEIGVQGRLRPNMLPVVEDLNSLGAFTMISGGVRNAPLLRVIAEQTKLKALSELSLKDVSGQFEVKNGFLNLAPITLRVQDITLTLAGRQSLAGELDYLVNIDAPSSKVDQAAFQALSGLTGLPLQASERVKINLRVSGKASAPKITGAGGGTADQTKTALTDAAEQELENRLGTEVELRPDSLKARAQETAQAVKDTARAVAAQARQQAEDSLRKASEALKQQAQQEAEKKLEEAIGPEAKEQLKNLRDRFGTPKKKGGG